jgi:hypothetical protein
MGLIGKAHEQNKDEMWVSDILTVIWKSQILVSTKW